MGENWMTIGQMKRQTQIPDRTLRRYVNLHGHHFKTKRDGRYILIAEEAIQTLVKIRHWYDSGWDLTRVEEALSQSGLPVVVTVDERREPVVLSAVEVVQLMRKEMAVAMTGMAERLDSLQNEVMALHNELDGHQKALEERLEERDRVLMETLRALQEQAQTEIAVTKEKRSWWPFGRRK